MTSLRSTRLIPVRLWLALAATLASASLSAQPSRPSQANPAASTLPATPATTAPAAPAPPEVPLRPSQLPANRAQVTYSNGILSVSADNSSLNQILRLIAVDTGMKITGGVADERVFGAYGPATPAEVLSELLDGTGGNMVIVQHDDGSLAELVLTPRTGGVTPPNPNAASYNDRPEPSRPAFDRSQQNPPESTVPALTNPGQPVQPAATATPAAPSTVTQPDSPNGVKTPQQIYEQLQRLRQQQQQPQTQPQ